MDVEHARWFLLGFFTGSFAVQTLTYFVLIRPRKQLNSELLARQTKLEAAQKERMDELLREVETHLEVCGERVKSS